MTEKIVTEEDVRYLVDPTAFVLALVGGPVIFTLLTFWLLLVPVFALVIGGLPYLAIGTPLLLVHLRYHPARVGGIVKLAVLGLLGGVLVFLALVLLRSDDTWTGFLAAGAMFAVCLPFAAGWAAAFALLYRAMARDFFTRPLIQGDPR